MARITYTAKRELVWARRALSVVFLNDLGNGEADLSIYKGIGASTYTRASEAATRLSTGLWKLDVASGVPRSYYYPDLYYGGYLGERASTQLISNSTAVRDMSGALWTRVNMTGAKTSVGIEGASNACTRLTATGANATCLRSETLGSAARVYSAHVKRITGTGNLQMTMDNGSTWTTISLSLAGFNEVQIKQTLANPTIGFRLVTSGDAIDVDWNQLEAGDFATTPIPLAGSRAADKLTIPAGNMVASAGTCYAEVRTRWPFNGSPPIPVAVVGTDYLYGCLQEINAASLVRIIDGTGINVATATASGGFTIPSRIVSEWASTGMAIVVNSGTVATQASFVNMNVASPIGIACFGSGSPQAQELDGTVKNLHIFSEKLASAEFLELAAADNVHILDSQYSLESDIPQGDLDDPFESTEHQPLGGGAPEVLLHRDEQFVDALSDIVTELGMQKYREFIHSCAAGEQFTFDMYGTLASPVDPRPAVLVSNGFKPQRLSGQLYRVPFRLKFVD